MIRLEARRQTAWLALILACSISAGCVKTGKAAAPMLPAGAIVEVRLLDTLDTATSRAGDEFRAVLASPLAIDGQTFLPAGAPVRGFVQKSVSAGALAQRSMLSIGLRSIESNGRRIDVETHSIARVSGEHKKRSMIPVAMKAADDREVRIPADSTLAFRLREPLML